MSEESQKKMEEKWFIPRKRYVPLYLAYTHLLGLACAQIFWRINHRKKFFSIWENGDYTVVFDRQKRA